MEKGDFSSRLASDEITTRGDRALTFGNSTTIKIFEITVMSGVGSSRD
jgi:hypothetical protein